MAHEYTYFPRGSGQIGSVMLDANVTSHLDSIAKRGSEFRDETVRERIAGLLDRLGDGEVLSMAGLGAAEGDIRREARESDYSNFHRRSAHALSLLNENRDTLRRWAAGEEVSPIKADLETERQKETERFFEVAVENFLMPSYALVLQAYWSYLTDPIPMRALRAVNRVATETRSRGSKEMMLATLLIAGTPQGQELALNIMKLRSETGLSETLDKVWNTSFDLTYTRLAVAMPLNRQLPSPVVFVTVDKHLSTFVNTIEPMGGAQGSNGSVLPLDAGNFDGLLRDDLSESVQKLMLASTAATANSKTSVDQVTVIRQVNARKYAEQLEQRFAKRYAPGVQS